jgi:peptide/nickel transport system substrate-binding protein
MSDNARISCHALGAIATGLLVIVASGCGGTVPVEPEEAGPEPRAGGTAVIGSISDVDSWNEYLSRQTFANSVHRRIFSRLVRERGDCRDRPYAHEPELAESWTVSDDGLTLTFRLREARWSDGAPIRASDVRFTWKAQTSPEVAWSLASSKDHITDVEVVDDRTVTFHFDRVYPYQMEDANQGGIIPEHVFGAIPFERWRSFDWSTVRIASGPFVLEGHRPGEEITLARNPRFYLEGLPRLDRVVVRIVPDAGNLLTQLLSGAVDYMENIPPWEADRVDNSNGMTLVAFDVPRFDYLGWNGARPPFDDPVVRRALTLAIDRESLVDEMLYGFGRVSTGPVLSYTWGAERRIEPWPYDPDEALRLLETRGYRRRDSDGVLERAGEPLRLVLTTNAGNRLRESVQVKIQEQLGRIGVRVELQPLEMRTFVQRNLSGEFDAYLGGWSVSGRVLKELFGSESTPPGGANVVAYSNPGVDLLLDELEGARSWREMKPTLSSIQHRLHEDQPYTFLYEMRRLAASGPRLRGVGIDHPLDPLAHLERDWIVQ